MREGRRTVLPTDNRHRNKNGWTNSADSKPKAGKTASGGREAGEGDDVAPAEVA